MLLSAFGPEILLLLAAALKIGLVIGIIYLIVRFFVNRSKEMS